MCLWILIIGFSYKMNPDTIWRWLNHARQLFVNLLQWDTSITFVVDFYVGNKLSVWFVLSKLCNPCKSSVRCNVLLNKNVWIFLVLFWLVFLLHKLFCRVLYNHWKWKQNAGCIEWRYINLSLFDNMVRCRNFDCVSHFAYIG